MTEGGRGSRVEGRGFHQLLAWQKAHNLALAAFRLSESFRPRHAWLASQLARAALSIPANIAEGYNRGSLKEYIQFLTISRGSLAEVEYYLLFACDAELVNAESVEDISARLDEAGRLLLSLLRSLEQKNGSAARRMIRDEGVPYGADPGDGQVTDLAGSTRDPRPFRRNHEHPR